MREAWRIWAMVERLRVPQLLPPRAILTQPSSAEQKAATRLRILRIRLPRRVITQSTQIPLLPALQGSGTSIPARPISRGITAPQLRLRRMPRCSSPLEHMPRVLDSEYETEPGADCSDRFFPSRIA